MKKQHFDGKKLNNWNVVSKETLFDYYINENQYIINHNTQKIFNNFNNFDNQSFN
jgi:hypothetical protein